MSIAKIEKALTTLVLEQPFFAVLAMKLELKEDNNIPTFGTDGKSLFFNSRFCNELSNREIVTLVCHEVLHCAFGHIWRIPSDADQYKWNIASDNEVNWELDKTNKLSNTITPFPFPEKYPPILMPQFRDLNAERIYRLLPDKQKDNQSQNQSGGQKQSINHGKCNCKLIPTPKNEQEKLKQEWDRAVIQAVKVGENKGNIPASIAELVKRIKSNKVSWKQLLKDYLCELANEDWTFRKVNHRYIDSDFILPSLYNEKVGQLIFAIDTSGSISTQLLKEFMAEAQNALDELNPSKLTIIFCDTDINHIDEYEQGDIIKDKIIGRGGTDFRPVFEYCNNLDDTPMVVVYLTDLEGSYPSNEPDYKTLWVSPIKHKIPFGELIQIEQ